MRATKLLIKEKKMFDFIIERTALNFGQNPTVKI